MPHIELPVPDLDELETHYFDNLREGRLLYQRTASNAWMPPRTEDPGSLSPEWDWAEASGTARLISWVTYHIAYHPYFEDKLPYQIAVIELDEGPRMIAPLDATSTAPVIDMPVRLDIREEGGWPMPFFVTVADASSEVAG